LAQSRTHSGAAPTGAASRASGPAAAWTLCDLVAKSVPQLAKLRVDLVVSAGALGECPHGIEDDDLPQPIEDNRGRRAPVLKGADDRVAVSAPADLFQERFTCGRRDLDRPMTCVDRDRSDSILGCRRVSGDRRRAHLPVACARRITPTHALDLSTVG